MTDTATAPDTAHGALVLAEQSVVTSAPVAAVKQQQDDYQALCRALLDDDDYQEIGKKKFPKKSAVRKLSVAFNVSCELLSMDLERDAAGHLLSATAIVRATAPNGRSMDGIGSCDVHEKCCPGEGVCTKLTHWEDSGRPTGHVHCTPGCPGSIHFSNAGHDLRATAHTRATNRACLDLFGMGQVSAEEIGDRGQSEPRSGTSRSTGTERATSQRGGTGRAATDKQVAMLRTKAKGRGYEEDGDADLIKEAAGREATDWSELTTAEASKVIDHLIAMEKAGEFAPQEAEVVNEAYAPRPGEEPF